MRGLRADVLVELHRLGDLVADREHRVQRRHRLLEDHRDLVAADLRQLALLERDEIAVLEQDARVLGDSARPVDQPHHRERSDGLAGPRLADDAERAALRDLEVDAVDGAQEALARVEAGAEVLNREQRRHARATPRSGRRGRDVDVALELRHHGRRVACLERLEQLAMLLDRLLEAAMALVAVEVGADARPDRPPDLHRVQLARGRDHDLVEAEVGLDELDQVVGLPGLLHQPDLLAELGEVLVRHRRDRSYEAVALERQADRDQDLVHLLVGDAEHDRAAVRERHDETLVLELSQRLAHRSAARAELRRERRLDQAVARFEAARDDRRPHGLDHLLTARPALRQPRRSRPGPSSAGWSRHVDNLKMVDNLGRSAVVYRPRCGSPRSTRLLFERPSGSR